MSRALASARRADWRFLLPEPGLERVACLPPHDPELIEALVALGAQVERLELPAPRAEHDVAVLCGGPCRAVAAARAQLRPGGWLYAEVPGRATPRWTRALRAGGFEDVGAHWLWPDARACREMVELERGALLHALSRRDPGARVRARATAAGVLVRLGLFRLAIRRAAVIGRRP